MNEQFDRYLAHGWLTPTQHKAGRRFAEDHAAACRYLAHRSTDDRSGAELYRLACRELGDLRPVAVAVLVDRVGTSTWAERAGLRRADGLPLLREALSLLARMYGLERAA